MTTRTAPTQPWPGTFYPATARDLAVASFEAACDAEATNLIAEDIFNALDDGLTIHVTTERAGKLMRWLGYNDLADLGIHFDASISNVDGTLVRFHPDRDRNSDPVARDLAQLPPCCA